MDYDPNKPTKFEWCIGQYEGDKAQYVMALANEGICYFIRSTSGSGKGLTVEAAFRRPIDGPTPDHLNVADPVISHRLDQLHAQRVAKPHDQTVDRASDETVERIRETLAKRKPNKV